MKNYSILEVETTSSIDIVNPCVTWMLSCWINMRTKSLTCRLSILTKIIFLHFPHDWDFGNWKRSQNNSRDCKGCVPMVIPGLLHSVFWK